MNLDRTSISKGLSGILSGFNILNYEDYINSTHGILLSSISVPTKEYDGILEKEDSEACFKHQTFLLTEIKGLTEIVHMMEVPMRLAVLPSNEDTPADHEEVEEPDDDEEEEEDSIQQEFQHVIPSSNTNRSLITNTRSSSESPRPASSKKNQPTPCPRFEIFEADYTPPANPNVYPYWNPQVALELEQVYIKIVMIKSLSIQEKAIQMFNYQNLFLREPRKIPNYHPNNPYLETRENTSSSSNTNRESGNFHDTTPVASPSNTVYPDNVDPQLSDLSPLDDLLSSATRRYRNYYLPASVFRRNTNCIGHIFQVINFLCNDDQETCKWLGRMRVSSFHGCPYCPCNLKNINCKHDKDQCTCPDKIKPKMFNIDEMIGLGLKSLPMTILWERIQFYQVQVKNPGFVEDYPEKADHYSKQIESLSEMMFTLLSQYNTGSRPPGQYSYSTAEQAYHQFINQNQGMVRPPVIRMPLFFYMNCALHVKLCLTRLCFDITQSVFAASELRPLLIEIVRTLKLSYFSSWFKKEYENDTDKTTLLQLVGRDCDVLLSVMPAIITGLMNMYSTLRNNINFQKLFTLWKTYKTMAKPHLTHYYVTEEEIAQCQTKAYAFFEAVSGWSNERITWYVHWVKEHLSEYQNFLVEQGFRFDETRWFGVGAFSNQGSEHMNKVLKRRLLRNAMKNSWKYFQGLNGQIILTLHNYGEQVEQEPFCLRCNQLGQQRLPFL